MDVNDARAIFEDLFVRARSYPSLKIFAEETPCLYCVQDEAGESGM